MYNDDNNLNDNEYNSGNNMSQDNFQDSNNSQGGYTEQDNSTQYRYSGSNIPYNNGTETDNNYNSDNNSASQNGYSSSTGYYNNGYQSQDNNGYNTQQGNAYYYNTQNNNAQGNNTPHKKKGNAGKAFKKFFKSKGVKRAGAAIVCGVVAGVAMLGTFYAGVKLFPGITNGSNNYEIATVSTAIPSSSVVSDGSVDVAGVTMDVSSVAEAALPAMVALKGTTTVSTNSYYGLFGGTQAREASTSGTGIIVGRNDTELLILTNNHVIEDVNDLQCVFVDDSSVSATVKGSKSDKDIAVVAVNISDISSDTLSKIAIAELGDSDDVTVGQQVVVIGNALGEGQSVTTGIISALNRSITVNNITFSGLFMTDAAINSGNSGGALLNASGKVIGINFAKTSEDGVEGMAYSIPVSNVRELIDTLMNRQTRTKVSTSDASYLGISAMDITSSMASQYGYPQGILIRQVASGSAAEKAGLGAYDIIVSFDDQSITSFAGLQSTMQYYKAGETVKIEYYHLEGSQYVLKSTDVTLDKKN